MSTRYIYVPFREKLMDEYAAALVATKNKQRLRRSMYALVARQDTGEPLAVVQNNDRLYVLIHGVARGGFGSRPDYRQSRNVEVTGPELAEHLRRFGLKNRTIDLRLWSCYGGKTVRLTDANNVEIQEGGKGIDSSFLLQLASNLKTTHEYISFTGYTLPVVIDPEDIKATGVKRVAVRTKLQGHGETVFAGTSGFKQTIDAVKTNGSRPCYLTTATCLSLGLPDDCPALRTLRWYRDAILLSSPAGRLDIAQYYATAPQIVTAINQRSDAAGVYQYLQQHYLAPTIVAVQSGAYGEAYQRYGQMVAELHTRFLK
jgi:hypothetical protein